MNKIKQFLNSELFINIVLEFFIGGIFLTAAWWLLLSTTFDITSINLWQGIKLNAFIYFVIIVPIKRNTKG